MEEKLKFKEKSNPKESKENEKRSISKSNDYKQYK